MRILLRFRAKLCYAIATILSLITIALIVMLVIGYLPEFATYPIDYVVKFIPDDNDGLLVLCFFGLIIGIIVVPGILIFGFIKLGHHLEKQSWIARRRRPITTV